MSLWSWSPFINPSPLLLYLNHCIIKKQLPCKKSQDNRVILLCIDYCLKAMQNAYWVCSLLLSICDVLSRYFMLMAKKDNPVVLIHCLLSIVRWLLYINAYPNWVKKIFLGLILISSLSVVQKLIISGPCLFYQEVVFDIGIISREANNLEADPGYWFVL